MHNAITNPDNWHTHQDTVGKIANLATATASDRVAIVQLMATTARLTTEISTVNENLVVVLQTKRAICGIRGGRDRAVCRARYGSGSPTPKGTAGVVDLDLTIQYC